MILGAHVSTAGGVSKGTLEAAELGVPAIQIFSKNQHQWNAKPFEDKELAKWFDGLKANGVTHAVSHAAYLINLCAPDADIHARSLSAFLDELVRGDQLGLVGVVLHPGSHMKTGEENGLQKIADSLRRIFDQHPDGKALCLLEVTAGQGSHLGYRFEHIAELLRRVNAPSRMGVCLDTCHIHSAGYDWTSSDGYEQVFTEFDKVVGLEQIKCFHLNDSKKALGSRVDRHEHIGDGTIGASPFKRLLEDRRFRDIPGLLETPGETADYARNLATLKALLD
ncbi:MAG: deoxyribonuclease IV [Calditrichaeota bacterium]|nr:deoxyribonuclease IV [Calditrichota bacterium]